VDVQAIAAWLVGLAAGLGALGWLVTKTWRGLRSLGHLADDLRGEPARPGVPARPGIMDRLAFMEHRLAVVESDVGKVKAEVTPNGGGSLKDAVTRIEQQQRRELT
jgi:hypothetical protein